VNAFLHTVKIGDLLTLGSVLIAAGVFFYTRSKDRRAQRREYADRIRSAAGQTLARLNRCIAILDSFYEAIQVPITEADEEMLQHREPVRARDFLWKHLYDVKGDLIKLFRDEQIELAYAPLFGYRRDGYAMFSAALESALGTFDACFDLFRDASQETILGMRNLQRFKSAELGNPVRSFADEIQRAQRELIPRCLEPFRTELLKTIELGDAEIVDEGGRRGATVGAHGADWQAEVRTELWKLCPLSVEARGEDEEDEEQGPGTPRSGAESSGGHDGRRSRNR